MTLGNVTRTVVLLGALFCISGCATYRTTYSSGLPARGEPQETKQTFWVYGLVGDSNVDLQQTCPEGVSTISSKHTFVDAVLTGITLGIYSPMTVEVQCASGRVASAN